MWRPLVEYVARHEPRTLAFEFCIADTDPCKVMVFERYLTREDYAEVHRSSQPFLDFKAKLEMLFDPPVVTGQSYYETDAGFTR